MELQLKQIQVDTNIQPRVQLNNDIINEYAEALKMGSKFPPIVIFNQIGDDYWLADGFHRYYATKKIGKDTIEVDVRKGSKRDAILFAVGANATHGLRRTNVDKRKAVLTLLHDGEWNKWSDREIAKKCTVSNRFVSNLRNDSSVNSSQIESQERLAVRGGKVYTIKTGNIGNSKNSESIPNLNNTPSAYLSPTSYEIYNEDCIYGAKRFSNGSMDLIICDPPFGINGSKFDNHYNRDATKVLNGYVEVSQDKSEYYLFSLAWLKEAHRILKDAGSIYVVSGWTNYHLVRLAMDLLGFHIINNICWKYSFPVYTEKKFLSSHYLIIYAKKHKDIEVTFNKSCRFEDYEVENGRKLQAQDREDVWLINRNYQVGVIKNQNKLPDELVIKMLQYSSKVGDKVCDFFMGNFTTAFCALKLARIPVGFEINPIAYSHFISLLSGVEYGCLLKEIPENNEQSTCGLQLFR